MTMSEPLVITISHRLGKDEALSRIQGALGKASSSFPALHVEQETWTGDRMDFRVRALGQVAAGNVQVGEQDVRLEVTLPPRPCSAPSKAAAASSSRRNDGCASIQSRATPLRLTGEVRCP